MSTIQVTNINDLSDNAALVTDNGGIKTDKLTGKTTAGSISVVGEGNSTTTNLQQGLLKMFVRGNSSAAFTVSFNTSSSTDLGDGNYDYAFTNNMSATEYPVTTSAQTASAIMASYSNVRTTAIEVDMHNSSGSNTNSGHTIKVHGDLA